MKKNKTMRAASVLTVATLLSTSIVSGTFAKYVSEGSAGDEARVAKWGVVINGSGNLFSTQYLTATNTPTNGVTEVPGKYVTDDTISVNSSNDDMLVAPGTKSDSEGLSFGITGTPEVDTRVKATIKAKDVYLKAGNYAVMTPVAVNANTFAGFKGDDKGLYTLNASGDAYSKVESGSYDAEKEYYRPTMIATVADDYYPVVYTLAGPTAKTGKATDIAENLFGGLEANDDKDDSENSVYEFEANYNTNTNLATALSLSDETITWKWEYNKDIDSEWDNIDFADTILGDLAAAEDTYDIVCLDTTYIITADDDTGVVTGADNKEYGCIRTTFDIDIEAVQID